jgi:hypothetical protein
VDKPLDKRVLWGVVVEDTKARRIELDRELLGHMVATKQYAESWIELEKIRDKFLERDDERALYGLPPRRKNPSKT